MACLYRESQGSYSVETGFRKIRRTARKNRFLVRRPTVPVVLNMGDMEPLCEGLSQEHLENVSVFRGDVNVLRAERGEDSIDLCVAMKYLKAARYDSNKAMDIYKNYQKHRETYQLGKLKVHREPLCTEIGSRKMEIIGTYDREGAPLVLFTGSKHGIKHSESKSAMQLLFYILDQLSENERSQEFGVVFLMDLRDTSLIATSYISNILSVLRDGYPLYIKDIYFINTPPAIKKSQGILRFLKQETLKAKEITYSELSVYFDLSHLPLSLGGTYTPGKEPTYPFCSIKTTRPMAKRNLILRSDAANGLGAADSTRTTVNSLTRMFETNDTTEPQKSTPSHKLLPPTPPKQKATAHSPFSKKPSYHGKQQTNGHPPTPPVKPSKAHSSETPSEKQTDNASKGRGAIKPPGSPKKVLSASISHPDVLSDDRTEHSPPSKRRGVRFFRNWNRDAETKADVKSKSNETTTKAGFVASTSVSHHVNSHSHVFTKRASDELLTASCSPSIQYNSRGRTGSDGDKPSRGRKALIPIIPKGGEAPSTDPRQTSLLPPQHLAPSKPPASNNSHKYEEVAGGPWDPATQESPHKKTRSFDRSDYQNLATGLQNLQIAESVDKNGQDTITIQTKGVISPSPQLYQNVVIPFSNSHVPGPSNHRAPVPTVAPPEPPVYQEVGQKLNLIPTQIPTHGGAYEEVSFKPRPACKISDDGYISDDDTLFGHDGPPGSQAVIYANFGPDEGNQWMTLNELGRHIDSKGTNGLAEEYLKIKNEPLSGHYTTCRLKCNLPKNRYKDVVCYDETRVKLKQIKSVEGSDYIHANYVSGYNKPEAFILTQGPKDKTVADFWRLVWEKQVHVIVMVTRCVEMMKRKCAQYWPEKVGTSVTHRKITVEVTQIQMLDGFEQRTLKVTMKGEVERTLTHFQFLAWPDYGVPTSGSSVINLLFAVREAQAMIAKSSRDFKHRYGPPILVHCSAGVGRSGAFCTLDSTIDELADKRKVNLQGIVRKMRLQRAYAIQTEEQYEFCYRTLLEYAKTLS